MGTPQSLLICLSPFVRLLPQLPSLCVPRAGSSLPCRKHKQRHPHAGRSLPVPTHNCCATCRMQHVLCEAAKRQRLQGMGHCPRGNKHSPAGSQGQAHCSVVHPWGSGLQHIPHVLFRKQTNKHENTSAVSIPQKVNSELGAKPNSKT